MEDTTKKLVIIASILGPIGAIFGSTTEIYEIIVPPVIIPEPEGMVDPHYEMLDEDSPPNKISWVFFHNGTDTFRITDMRVAVSSFVDIDCLVPSDDPVIFESQKAYLDPEPHGEYDLIRMDSTDSSTKQKYYFLTENGGNELKPFLYENLDPITIDYVLTDQFGNTIDTGKNFWTGMWVTWENIEEPGIQHETWSRANLLDNPEFCS